MKRPSAAARGYGKQHQAERTRQLRNAYGQPCHFCGKPMEFWQALDLDHTPDRDGYRGMTHASCNRSDGARRGNAKRKKYGNTPTTRRW